jgi:hypothetical protein
MAAKVVPLRIRAARERLGLFRNGHEKSAHLVIIQAGEPFGGRLNVQFDFGRHRD